MEPIDFEVMQTLAGFFLQNARPEKAVALLRAVTLLQPENIVARRALAYAHIKAEEPERALETLDQLAEIGSANNLDHLMRSQALSLLSRHDEASRAMHQYVAGRNAVEAGSAA